MQPNTTTLGRATVSVSIALLISTSAALGTYYGFTLGAHHHTILGIMFAAAALGGELLKPFAVIATFDAIRAFNLVRALACSLVAVICITYSLTAELALSAALRSDQTAYRSLKVDTVSRAKVDRERALAELGRIDAVRPVASLKTDLARLRTTPGADCDASPDSVQYGPVSRRVCPQVSTLEAELGLAHRKRELEQIIKQTSKALAAAVKNGNAIGEASPLAASLSSYAAATGHQWRVEQIAPWIALLVPLLLEIGSSLGLVVLRSLDRRATVPPAPSAAIQSVPAKSSSQLSLSPVPAHVPRLAKAAEGTGDDENKLDPRRELRSALLRHIADAGGALKTDQRGLAKLLEVSKSELNRALHTLADDGRILLSTDRRTGTRIELAPA